MTKQAVPSLRTYGGSHSTIVHLTYSTYYDLAMAFVRLSEFYESDNPEFRGKTFELEEYMRWYALNRGKGIFTYPDDWSGFNIPGKTIVDFFRLFDINQMPHKIRPMERILQRAIELAGVIPRLVDGRFCWDLTTGNDFCVIGTIESVKPDVLKHECRHALYYLYPTYREAVVKCIAKYPLIGLRKHLRKMGYCAEVVTDEVNAYVTSGLDPGMPRSLALNKLRGELLAIPVPSEYEAIFRN